MNRVFGCGMKKPEGFEKKRIQLSTQRRGRLPTRCHRGHPSGLRGLLLSRRLSQNSSPLWPLSWFLSLFLALRRLTFIHFYLHDGVYRSYSSKGWQQLRTSCWFDKRSLVPWWKNEQLAYFEGWTDSKSNLLTFLKMSKSCQIWVNTFIIRVTHKTDFPNIDLLAQRRSNQ